MTNTHNIGDRVTHVGKAMPHLNGHVGVVTAITNKGQLVVDFEVPVGATSDGLSIYGLLCNPCAVAAETAQ